MPTRPHRYVYLAYGAMSQTAGGGALVQLESPRLTEAGGLTPQLLLTVTTGEDRLSVASSLDAPHARNESFRVNAFGFNHWRLIRLLKSAKQHIPVAQSHSVGQKLAAPGL